MKFFLPRLLNKFKILEKINLNVKIKLNDKLFIIPVIRKNGFQNLFMTEIWMIDLFKKINHLLSGTFIDVGVNTGQTLLKLKSVNSRLKYIGFEPNPNCVYYVNELVSVNKLENIELYPVGISNNDNVLSLNIFYDNNLDSSATIIENFRDQKVFKKIHVPVFQVKTIIGMEKTLSDVCFIKIDVEGAELEVVQSFIEVIKKCQPFILIEILPVYNETNKFRIERQIQIERIFKELNYTFFRIDKSVDDNFKGLFLIKKIGVHSDLNKCDYLIVPEKYLNELNYLN